MATRTVTFEAMNPPTSLILSNVTVVYEPSVFGGDGTEVRRNIVFEVPPDVAQAVRTFESPLDPRRLCSCIKDDNRLKCKIQMDKVSVYDVDRGSVPLPDEWRGLNVNAIVTVKGMWSTKQHVGLSIEAHSVQVLGAGYQTPPECPFQAVLAA